MPIPLSMSRLWPFALTIWALAVPTLHADVLAPSEYVLSYNLGYAHKETEESLPNDRTDIVSQTTFTHTLTGLLGLGLLPWQHHLYVSAGLKSIEQSGSVSGLEFSDLASVDTKIALQHLLWDFQPQYEPYGLELSLRTGLNLPTTPEGYRLMDKVTNPAPDEEVYPTFDKGSFGYILALSLSGYYRFVWSDIEMSVKQDFAGDWLELGTTLGLGVSISELLAVQTSYSMVNSTELGSTSTSNEVGAGVVFNYSPTWSVGAGGYHNMPEDGDPENSYYLSLRTQSL